MTLYNFLQTLSLIIIIIFGGQFFFRLFTEQNFSPLYFGTTFIGVLLLLFALKRKKNI